MEDFVEMVVGFFVEAFFEAFAGMFSGLFSIGDLRDTEMLSVVPRLPNGAGVLLAKGGR